MKTRAERPEKRERPYAYGHRPIAFEFRQDPRRFFVEEIPLPRRGDKGSWIHLRIRKRDLSTWRLISILKRATGASDREIGYAGLKDKNATTVQSISLPRRYERSLKKITTDRIRILEIVPASTPLHMGAHDGNRFEILLERLGTEDFLRLRQAADTVAQEGFPNYFGYQRFGEDGASWRQGREIAHSGKRLHGAKEKLLVASYQAHLFNRWLGERVRISRAVTERGDLQILRDWPEALLVALREQPRLFKIFLGDVMRRSPSGSSYRFCDEMRTCAREFAAGRLMPTGLLPGRRVVRARQDAGHLERNFDDEELHALGGDRRAAWVLPRDLRLDYQPEKRSLNISFVLPPGAYATTLLEELGHRPLRGPLDTNAKARTR